MVFATDKVVIRRDYRRQSARAFRCVGWLLLDPLVMGKLAQLLQVHLEGALCHFGRQRGVKIAVSHFVDSFWAVREHLLRQISNL